MTYALVSLEKTPISVEFSNWVPINQLEGYERGSDIRTAMMDSDLFVVR